MSQVTERNEDGAGGSGEMADATDLKSVGSNPVTVRIPPSAPSIILRFSGILLCKDARHIFGFTGLAKFDKFDTRRWLLNALYECCPPDYQINKIMPRLKDRATADFQALPVLKSLEAKRFLQFHTRRRV